MRSNWLLSAVFLLSASCSDSGFPVSKGLKIFVTSQVHGADFANDPILAGANAIEKADAFCSSDPAKPSAATYKALLVDGVNRDAKTLVDWVLKPSTAYYRAHGDVLIGTTTSSGIFAAAYQPLANSIGEPPTPFTGAQERWEVWTGIGDSGDFSVGDDCAHWTSMSEAYSAWWGRPQETNGVAFSGALGGCAYIQYPIYCVEQ